MWISRKKYEAIVSDVKMLSETVDRVTQEAIELRAVLDTFMSTYPFRIGETVYDLQLRNDKGRYTKKNPSYEHSVINEVVVDEKNYFKLVARYNAFDVFKIRADAEDYLKSVCGELIPKQADD